MEIQFYHSLRLEVQVQQLENTVFVPSELNVCLSFFSMHPGLKLLHGLQVHNVKAEEDSKAAQHHNTKKRKLSESSQITKVESRIWDQIY